MSAKCPIAIWFFYLIIVNYQQPSNQLKSSNAIKLQNGNTTIDASVSSQLPTTPVTIRRATIKKISKTNNDGKVAPTAPIVKHKEVIGDLLPVLEDGEHGSWGVIPSNAQSMHTTDSTKKPMKLNESTFNTPAYVLPSLHLFSSKIANNIISFDSGVAEHDSAEGATADKLDEGEDDDDVNVNDEITVREVNQDDTLHKETDLFANHLLCKLIKTPSNYKKCFNHIKELTNSGNKLLLATLFNQQRVHHSLNDTSTENMRQESGITNTIRSTTVKRASTALANKNRLIPITQTINATSIMKTATLTTIVTPIILHQHLKTTVLPKSKSLHDVASRAKSFHQIITHSTPLGRRHIEPDKLQFTKEISIKQGRLMGIRRIFHTNTGLRNIDQYLGIPYAEAPIGNRRFMPPGTPLAWQGLRMAHHLPPVCPQKLPKLGKMQFDASATSSSTASDATSVDTAAAAATASKGRYKHWSRLLPYLKTESEDCLYLNVYVPSESEATASVYPRKYLHPVIVYIHGESFEWNSGNAYDGSILASYGEVIVITVNYRLGALGFMRPSLHDNAVANLGLLDQVAALHWIKENIEYFGGDRNSITLMGHTTGAACINFLMISPVASGLFHRAILMSGSAMSDWAASNHSLQLTMQIADGLACPLNDDNEQLLTCLRQRTYQDILRVPIPLQNFTTSWGPIVDGHVIPDPPFKAMGFYNEYFNRYDLLFGITESESYHALGSTILEDGLSENERDNLLHFYMKQRVDVRPDLALAATLKKYSDVYTNPIKATKMEHRDVVLDILSDARVVGPLIQTGLFHAEAENRHNYMYVFGHNSHGGPHATLPYSVSGEELAFVFGAPLASIGLFHSMRYTKQEKLLSEAVMSYWSNFAKTGNPKSPWKGTFLNLQSADWERYDMEWPAFNRRSQTYLNIGIPPSVGYKYRQMYMNFWIKEFPNEMNQIAAIQQQPYFQEEYQNTQIPHYTLGRSQDRDVAEFAANNRDANNGANHTTKAFAHRRRLGSELITGHINKFGSRDNGNEDPVRTLKLLLQQSLGAKNAESTYNTAPTFGITKSYERQHQHPHEYEHDPQSSITADNHFYYGHKVTGIAANNPNRAGDMLTIGQGVEDELRYDNENTNTNSRFLSFHNGNYLQNSHDMITPSSAATGTSINNKVMSNTTNHSHVGNMVENQQQDNGQDQDHLHKSETTLHLLIGLIVIFIVLNVIIYSTYFLQKKKKSKSLQRKLGGILTYDGTTDDELKRSKLTTLNDGEDSYMMDMVRKSNTYEAVKMDRSPINGFILSRQLSCSTMDTHTKVCEWMDAKVQRPCLQRRPSIPTKESKKSASFSSLGRSGSNSGVSFGKSPVKVSVAVDATPQGRGNSVLEQEPIEVTKLKNDGRNIIICQEVTVEDQDMLTPQESLDNTRYSLSRQHSTVTAVCETELLQPQHKHSISDPIDMGYSLSHEESTTSFIMAYNNINEYEVNVTSKDDTEENDLVPNSINTEQQLSILKRRKYPKVLPALQTQWRSTDSPPMSQDVSTTYKRNSMPPNGFYSPMSIKHPPLPPPRTAATLGRLTSISAADRRISNCFTNSPLEVALQYAEEDDEVEPQITQNTLIVGPLITRRDNDSYHTKFQFKAPKHQLPTVTNEKNLERPNKHELSRELGETAIPAHLTEKIFNLKPPLSKDCLQYRHAYNISAPTTPVQHTASNFPYVHYTAITESDNSNAMDPPDSPDMLYSQPKKASHIPRIKLSNIPCHFNNKHSNIDCSIADYQIPLSPIRTVAVAEHSNLPSTTPTTSITSRIPQMHKTISAIDNNENNKSITGNINISSNCQQQHQRPLSSNNNKNSNNNFEQINNRLIVSNNNDNSLTEIKEIPKAVACTTTSTAGICVAYSCNDCTTTDFANDNVYASTKNSTLNYTLTANDTSETVLPTADSIASQLPASSSLSSLTSSSTASKSISTSKSKFASSSASSSVPSSTSTSTSLGSVRTEFEQK